jgi:hypothetical protein
MREAISHKEVTIWFHKSWVMKHVVAPQDFPYHYGMLLLCMVLSFDSLRVIASYGWVKGSILGTAIQLQDTIILPLLMHFVCLEIGA